MMGTFIGGAMVGVVVGVWVAIVSPPPPLVEVEMEKVVVEKVECDWLGPYPYSGGLDMYVVICPKGVGG